MRKMREKKPNPPTKFELACAARREVLQKGLILCVDPSIGSKASMPGFALINAGEVVHSGILKLDAKLPPNRRLHTIQNELFAVTPHVDLLLIEDIPPYMNRAGGFRNAAVILLHWSVGAILSSYDADSMMIPIPSWHKWVERNIGEFGVKYHKGDEKDALAMVCAVFDKVGLKLKNHDAVMKVLTDVE
jgi:hypothetical protein